jgi:micrococcal nuclease
MKKYKKQIILGITIITAIVYFLLGEDYEPVVQDVIKNTEILVDSSSNEKDEYLVTHIVDGDTFDISTGERVRMIGIDTPERGKYFYKEATNRLDELIGNKKVILIKDVSETDKYGRILRHVYIDDVWINKQMIEEGFARFVTFPPDVMHVEEFREAQKYAKKNKLGLWVDK